MAENKKIIILVKSSPFKGNFCEEALRSVLGLTHTLENNNVRAVFIGDGVWFSVKDMKQFMKYMISFTSLGIGLFLERESVEWRNISTDRIADGFSVASREDISKIFKESDFVLSF